MATVERAMETPAQMRERLDRMGEERVRSLLSSDYFEAKTLPLVRCWLEENSKDSSPGQPTQEERLDNSLAELRGRLSKLEDAVVRAAAVTAAANKAQKEAMRVTWVALVMGSLGVGAAIVALVFSAV